MVIAGNEDPKERWEPCPELNSRESSMTSGPNLSSEDEGMDYSCDR